MKKILQFSARQWAWALPLLCCSLSCEKKEKEQPATAQLGYAVVSTLPHDVSAFTQGLVIHDGKLLESTGQEGSSWIAEVDVETGVSDKKASLSPEYFGEGITVFGTRIYQLTWRNKTGFIYDLRSFSRTGTFTYQTEGWGITHDSTSLIMSDGSSRLYFLDTLTMKQVRTLEVTENGVPVTNLNELEYVEGSILANVWQTDRIVRIDPVNGQVTGYIDLSILTGQARSLNPSADVLNGIAWHPETRTLLVTGKYWPNIFILKLSRP